MAQRHEHNSATERMAHQRVVAAAHVLVNVPRLACLPAVITTPSEQGVLPGPLQCEAEASPVLWFTLHINRAAVGFNQAACNR